MRPLLPICALGATLALCACGHSIGDSCSQSSECSPDGDRICDTSSPGGYCTVPGCDFDTCPDEAECVRFYSVSQLTRECPNGQADCSIDEVCTIATATAPGKCAPISAETRFCMLKCGGHGDCRENYECRDPERMNMHGGEPVPDPNASTSTLQRFCAPAKPCLQPEDCDFGDVCNVTERFCQRGS